MLAAMPLDPAGLEAFLQLARSRRAARRFSAEPIPPGVLEALLEAARWAPSGFNLQPTRFVVVAGTAARARLLPACLGQKQVLEAPATVVFVGDATVVESNFERVVELEREAGAMDSGYEAYLRRVLPVWFGPPRWRPLRAWTAVRQAIARRRGPAPDLPVLELRTWLAKQVMLAAMNFMLAAEAAGLATTPMEGFDERRVKAALDIPRRHVVPVVIPVGFSPDRDLPKSRLPLAESLHRDGWSSRDHVGQEAVEAPGGGT